MRLFKLFAELIGRFTYDLDVVCRGMLVEYVVVEGNFIQAGSETLYSIYGFKNML